MEAVGLEMPVAGTHRLDSALVEGVSCETMDLRRSVMMKILFNLHGTEVVVKMREVVQLDDAECGDGTLTILWGSRGDV
jgi:hypothetical protein